MAQTLPANEQWRPRVMQAIQYGFGAFDFLKENFDKNNLIFIKISDIIYT
jgi:hypothetical protein